MPGRKRQTGPEQLVQQPKGGGMEVFPGVSMDANVRFGKPCITGTRVDVATIVADLGAGETIESVQDSYSLSREQVLTALRYAAHLAAHLPPAVSEAS